MSAAMALLEEHSVEPLHRQLRISSWNNDRCQTGFVPALHWRALFTSTNCVIGMA